MQVAINPCDSNMFASASLDKTIKIWSIQGKKTSSNYSLIGHKAGVNCIDFSKSFDKPQIVSGGDDGLVKVWDYQSKQCLYTFEPAHQDNVSNVAFHPDMPLIFSGGEDHVLNVWNANAFKHETFLNYGLGSVWSINCLQDSNYISLGYEEATVVIKVGKETPLATYVNGKVVFIKSNEFQTANFKLLNEFKDGEKIKAQIKDLGHCEMYA